MDQITRFDRRTLKKVREQMDEALALAGEELGIRFTIGNIRFTNSSCNIKVESYIEDAAGALKSIDKLVWDSNCSRYGLNPSDHGVVFVSPQSGETFKLKTIKPKNRKYPIIGDKLGWNNKPTGKTCKFTMDLIRSVLTKRNI